MLRLHRCLRLYPLPPPLPAVCRQSTASSPAPKRSFPPAGVRAQNPLRRAAVIPAVGGELQRGRVDDDDDVEDLGEALDRTRQLVECAMFAAVAGLAYFLSNSLAIENYFSCFFPLPTVISSLRWGLEAGRKTVVATVLLLFTLSGPVKASTYLKHRIQGTKTRECFAREQKRFSERTSRSTAYAWSSWSSHGYYLEVGDQLDCFHFTLLHYPCSRSLRICFSVIIPDKREYSGIDNG